jgi:ATP:cob(I)alamin adenosyltransferase
MTEKNKVYTRTGDEGMTSLIGGKRVPKYDDRVEAYGSVDELSAFVGVLFDLGMPEPAGETLIMVQDKLFTLESHFALDENSEISKMIPSLLQEDIQYLEKQMDEMNEVLPPMKAFVIPGGNMKASQCHVCRTVCRRAERRAWKLATNSHVDLVDLKFLNRLSDYFFVLSRYLQFLSNSSESHWQSVK